VSRQDEVEQHAHVQAPERQHEDAARGRVELAWKGQAGPGQATLAAMTVDRSKLLATLRTAAERLTDVEEKKMFGCEALFVNGAIFALVWKTGRIGVKLPEPKRFDALAALKGTEPWRAGPMVMAHWLLVPPSIDADVKKLVPWVKEAHAMAAAGLGATKRKPAKKTSATKTAAKKTTTTTKKKAASKRHA
jgi:TfoX/Sxy family transcriptional regulator of competence genes